METLEEQSSTETIDRSTKMSLPIEIIEQILSRLPVESILRFKSVCKQWLSCISDPSFPQLHLTSTHRAALFLTTYNRSTSKHNFFSAAGDGGPVTHLMTLDHAQHIDITKAEHLNGGLVCISCVTLFSGQPQAFVVNPSTRKLFKLPNPPNFSSVSINHHMDICYLFGFHESRNELKVLLIRKVFKPAKVEFMIFSMSNHSWRNIDVEPPVGFNWDSLHSDVEGSVCVNSVIHVMVRDLDLAFDTLSFDILAFDLRTEKFSVIHVPQGVVPHQPTTSYSRNGKGYMKDNTPFIMKIDGCLGVVCHDRVAESNGVCLWILQDYDNRVWVRETVEFPGCWNEFDGPFPLPVDAHMGEVIFSSRKVSGNVIRLHVYDMKTGCFKSLQEFTLDDQFLCFENVRFSHIKCYVESIMPL